MCDAEALPVPLIVPGASRPFRIGLLVPADLYQRVPGGVESGGGNDEDQGGDNPVQGQVGLRENEITTPVLV